MGKKGRKTRWRKLPIPIGNGGGSGQQRQDESEDHHPSQPSSEHQPSSRTTFNEDEYTKITTPRQDMLFKKGYLGRKKTTPTPSQDTTDAQSADSIESEQYCCEEQVPQYMYPAPAGYIDPTGIYYVPNYEVYDPYTGGVTVVVGPAPGFAPHPVLAALPCAPVPLQPVEWFLPQPPTQPPYNPPRKKSSNSIDSQNWSGQSSESNCPPGSPQDSTEQCEVQPYVYPGYMFGQPVYNVNGVNVQGAIPTAQQPPSDQSKRRKKRRRRRRGGVTDEGSESSCEEVCSIEAPGSSASSSKTNSDSGIATDPCGASGGQGSLSSLSNDEAEKDSKSLPSEGDTPIVDVKEEELTIEPEPEQSDSANVKEEESKENFTTDSPISESVATPVEEVENESHVTPVTEEDVSEEIPENLQEIPEESEATEISQKEEEDEEEEVMLETTEGFETFVSDDEFEEKDKSCSSDESTLPCTADDRSIDESQTEIETVERLVSDLAEARLHEHGTDSCLDEDGGITGFNDVTMYDLDHLELEPDPPPVAPPRRKKCAKTAEKLASKLSEEIVTNAVSCAAEQRWPITSAVTKWLEDSEDEIEIEEAEEATTGQKNGEGNPFPAPFHSGSGTRVASTEWYNSRVREMCDPISSVNKYYRLALPMKTGPFPCGVCCIIQ